MARILYIASEVLPGLPQLHGTQLVDALATHHDVRVVGAVLPDDHDYLDSDKFGDALLSADQVPGYDAIVIEDGWKPTGGAFDRIPVDTVTSFLRAGGQVVVADIDRNIARQFSHELTELADATGIGPVYGPNGTVTYLHDDLDRFDGGSEGAHIFSFDPTQMLVADWLAGAWEGVESVLAAMPVQLRGATSSLATGTSSTEVLSDDGPADALARPVWAGVVEIGTGHLALIGAGVTHDRWVGLNPGNAVWLSNLLAVMVRRTTARTARLGSRPAPGSGASADAHPPGPSDEDLRGLLDQEENARFERKASFLEPTDPNRPRPQADMQFDVGKAICALANADGGYLLIGQHDTKRNREVIGLANDFNRCTPKDRDGFQLRLLGYVNKSVRPGWVVLGLRMHWLEVDGKEVLVVEVPPHHEEAVEVHDSRRSHVFVRAEGSSPELTGADLVRWTRKRFN